MALKTYAHPGGQYRLKYPQGWQVNAKDNAMIVKSEDRNGKQGVFGILQRPDDQPNEAAVAKEFSAKDRPRDLVQMPTHLAGLQGTKVVGSSKDDPNASLVEYYVKNSQGHQYYILLRAPKSDWKRYNPSFSAMLDSLSFKK